MTKPTRVYCENCDREGGKSEYCPSCGEEDPWVEEYRYDMDDVDFPIIVEYEHYDDNYGMWRNFCYTVFGTEVSGDQVANIPDGFPRMKYTVVTSYWKITENSREGPFDSRKEALEA